MIFEMGGYRLKEFVSHVSLGSRRNQSASVAPAATLITRLPPELLAHILAFLPGTQIANSSRVCKRFYEASLVDQIWQTRCRKEYGLTITGSQRLSAKQVYTLLLHKYGKCLGLWRPDIAHYGGLVQVIFEGDRITGTEWRAPKETHEPLRKFDLFSIQINEDFETQVLCLRGYSGPHKCNIVLKKEGHFFSKCCVPEKHRHPNGSDQEFQEWVNEETTNAQQILHDPFSQELRLMKFLMIKQYENSYDHHRIESPLHVPNVVISPGIFKGTYGAHGIEMVMLKYEDDGFKVKAVKISGDPNVPAGEVTFTANLRLPVVLTESDQESIARIETLPKVSSPVHPAKMPPQPFVVPEDCIQRVRNAPNWCKARFYGFGQVAGHGFTNNSSTPGHWIVFSEDLFGFLWLGLFTLSMFHRVKEPLGLN
jgi:F-box protein 31